MFTPNLIALAPLSAAILCAVLMVFAFRMRSGMGKRRAIVLFFALSWYALGAALELCSTDLEGALFFAKLEYLGIALAAPCWLALVLVYAGYEFAGSKSLIAFLFLIPAITIGIALSPLMIPYLYLSAGMSFSGSFPVMHIVPGPWYWVYTGYNIVMMILGTTVLTLMFFRTSNLFKNQIALMLLGSLAPFIAILLRLSHISLVPDLDVTPFALLITGLTIYPAISRYQFMDILPVAQSTVLRRIPVGIVVLDSLMRIREINPAASEILKVDGKKTIGVPVSDIVPSWDEIASTLLGQQNQYEFNVGEGREQEVYLVSRIPLDDVSTSSPGSILLFSAITERIRAEEQERRRTSELMTLLDSLPGYVYLKDIDGAYITANKGFCELFQVQGIIEGRDDGGILPVDFARQVGDLEQEILTGRRAESEFEGAIETRGKVMIISGKIVPFRDEDGSVAGIIGLGYDITARKFEEARVIEYSGIIESRNQELVALRDKLQAINRDLDNQVRQRTQEVDALLVQRDHFIEQLGHDLRTPLIPLVGLIPFLVEQEKDPDLARLLSQMKISVDVMQNMVEQVIHLAQLNSMYSITDRSTYELKDLITDVVIAFDEEIKKQNISVTLDIDPGQKVQLSPVHAPVIFRHVISNAIRYNISGGKIRIAGYSDTTNLIISIHDTGIGIDSSDLNKIFDEFYRTDRSRQSLDAKGLGLAIVRRMVTLNGGKIWAESDGPSQGSTFFIRLPLV